MSIVGSVAVRVVPSFTGMHRTIGRQFTGAGAEAGKTFSKSMGAAVDLRSLGGAVQQVGDNIAGVGSRMTRSITVPVAGATAAVGGLVGALGMGRLVGLDTAQAKLRGLGYDAESVERISNQVTDAIEGTMVTMAEGTNIAAGAMAAGVAEGEDLHRYIRLVGDAAAASGRPIDEMAMIFNRVQGSGKLMTQELNMLEQSVPGVSQALADSYGVSYEAFREMVTAGEVDAKHFREVMDDFMGGMGEEYSQSFEGMAKNVMAYIGILGENLLSGAFPQMKEELSNFVDFLASDDVATWAQGVGESIGNAFSTAVEWVRNAINWWINLDGSTQKLIGSIAGIAVAAGPVLLVVGKIISVIGGLISGIGVVVGWFSRLSTVLLGSTSNLTLLPRILTLVGKGLRVVTGPIGLVIGLLVAAWTQSEAFRAAIVDMGKAIWDAISGVWEALQPAFSGIGSAMSGVGEMAAWAGEMLGDGLAWVINTLIIPAIEWLGDAIAGAITWMTGLGDETTQQGSVVTGVWTWITEAISGFVTWLTGTAWPFIQSVWDGISSGAQWLWGIMESVWGWIQGAISGTVDWMTGTAWPMIQSVWDGIVFGAQWLWGILEPIFIMITAVFLYVGQTLWNIYTSYVKFMWDAFVAIVQWVWNSILQPTFNFIVSAFQALGTAFMWVWDNVVKPMWDMFVAIVRWVWTSIVQPIFQFIVNAFRGLGNSFMAVWTGILQPVFNFVGAIIRWLWENVARPMFNSITTAWRTMANWLRSIWTDTIRPAIDAFGNFVVSLYRNYVRPAIDWISDKWEWLSGKISDVWGTIKGYLQDFGDFVKDTLSNAIESGVDTIKSIWDTVAGFFRTPINWVINTVWNDGLREAYNAVADLINADKLGRVRGLGSVPAFAEGGYARRGWALVGEEGPELVNFSNPGRVYTADETRDALAGANPSSLTTEEVHAMADGSRPGRYGVGGNWFTRGARWVADKTGISDAIDWVRGKLADGFRAVVKPVVNRVSDFMSEWGGVGSLAGDFMDWGVEGIASLIDTKDQEQFSDGSYDGEFTANPGGFNRPMAGPITSRAGTRSYWGAFGNQHYGVDIGGPIGTAVRAMFSGVIRAISGGGNNRTVVMNHGGYDTAYMHMSAITRALGEQVSGGDVIARSGTAGSGPHGHFEYHPGGYYNPSMSAINSLIRDKGGLLYPGMNQVLNDTGRAEYVFNQQQFDNLNRIAANSNGGEGWTINQNNYQSGSQYRDAQDLRMTFRRERKKAGV